MWWPLFSTPQCARTTRSHCLGVSLVGGSELRKYRWLATDASPLFVESLAVDAHEGLQVLPVEKSLDRFADENPTDDVPVADNVFGEGVRVVSIGEHSVRFG